jgi:hypothetical protein
MRADLQDAVRQILEAVMFENWLRFYFIDGKEEGSLVVSVPEQGMARIREQYPHLAPLALELNGRAISFELSRRAVCSFILTRLDGRAFPRDTADLVLNSEDFQLEMQLFGSWAQGHEEQLDARFVDFAAWKRLFAEWRNSDKVKAWAAQLARAAGTEPDSVAH